MSGAQYLFPHLYLCRSVQLGRKNAAPGLCSDVCVGVCVGVCACVGLGVCVCVCVCQFVLWDIYYL